MKSGPGYVTRISRSLRFNKFRSPPLQRTCIFKVHPLEGFRRESFTRNDFLFPEEIDRIAETEFLPSERVNAFHACGLTLARRISSTVSNPTLIHHTHPLLHFIFPSLDPTRAWNLAPVGENGSIDGFFFFFFFHAQVSGWFSSAQMIRRIERIKYSGAHQQGPRAHRRINRDCVISRKRRARVKLRKSKYAIDYLNVLYCTIVSVSPLAGVSQEMPALHFPAL